MNEDLPKITVVTPSYNQAQFIEQTILSVIYQGYPNLEYIVMDGGSNDGSAEIIKSYEQYITYWQSRKDNGQSAAINEGFARGTGEILYWLNSDDMLMPGTLLKIGRMFRGVTEPAIFFGNCLHFYEGRSKTRGSDVAKGQRTLSLDLCDYMIQPSSFWNRAAWEKVGELDEDMHFSFDWEWFIRAEKKGIPFTPVKDYLSLYRIHESHKSGSGGNKRALENARLFEKYHRKGLGKAFLKWDRLSSKYKFFHNMVHASNRYSLTLLGKIIQLVLFPTISYREFKHISRL